MNQGRNAVEILASQSGFLKDFYSTCVHYKCNIEKKICISLTLEKYCMTTASVYQYRDKEYWINQKQLFTVDTRESLLTFAHAISVPLQLTVLHAGNDVKQGKDLLLGEGGSCWYHQAPREVSCAVVHRLVVAGVNWWIQIFQYICMLQI